jgi:hypothetical protein
MAHYVFTADSDGTLPTYKILAVAMNIDEDEAVRISGELAQAHGPVTATPVQAYAPRLPREGDVITGRAALILPGGSVIICTADAWGPVPASAPLIRQGGGYVRVNDDGIEPTPLVDDHLYKILHVGKTEPNRHGRTP